MDGRFSDHPFLNEQEEAENSPENSGDSPRSGLLNDGKMASTSSPRKSRRAVQKRVVSVPFREVEGSRLKGESAPPSDSWAWRKYGQKPIKGSPYPRGYYRCSSSKGCPARKQVERSRLDPTTLVITYSCEHNHSMPTSKTRHVSVAAAAAPPAAEVTSASTAASNSDDEKTSATVFELDPQERFGDLGEEFGSGSGYGFRWFSDLETASSSTMLESPIMEGGDGGSAVVVGMAEEEESLFADLGELPECSAVFRRAELGREEDERRRCNVARWWCGTTG
ncbi:hypothetical protein NMG60_11012876 [Bertholletia excelsa]